MTVWPKCNLQFQALGRGCAPGMQSTESWALLYERRAR